MRERINNQGEPEDEDDFDADITGVNNFTGINNNEAFSEGKAIHYTQNFFTNGPKGEE